MSPCARNLAGCTHIPILGHPSARALYMLIYLVTQRRRCSRNPPPHFSGPKAQREGVYSTMATQNPCAEYGERRCSETRERLWPESTSLPDTATHFNTAHTHLHCSLCNTGKCSGQPHNVSVELTTVLLMKTAEAPLLRHGHWW